MKLTKETVFLALLISAVLLVCIELPTQSACADEQNIAPSNLTVLPIQIGRDSYGIAMVDSTSEHMWVYEISKSGSNRRLRLIAARDWKFDKQLSQYNTSEPTPDQVKVLLEKANNIAGEVVDTEK